MGQSQAQILKQRMTRGAGLVVPGASNALAARVIETIGFEALLVTGAGVTNGYLGAPDVGIISLKELVDHVWAIVDSVDIPVIADADTGFGNAVNVNRTVKMMERAGAVAMQLEDQVFPKRCGHFDGKDVIPVDEMIYKIKAAVDARQSPDFQILARTDVRAVEGMDAAIERANLFREAGADLLFIEAPRTVEELARIPAEVPGIHICNMVIGGKTPVLRKEELAAMGYGGIVYANAALQSALQGMKTVLGQLKENGSVEGLEGLIVPFAERQAFVNHDHYKDMEKRYTPPREARSEAAE
ncbi:isocitrate lyase/PEP mutase family protein [Acuticoccus kandeliae]|uniref:isocitrate lyase/PEP mutase family protein n=1 Tax=Acuticoccus kandeliae TaxID=2073160 RepID=UPI000D3E0500|nr:oxaloacetate decarboxylase [Acuticoccus kandeliae]